jgi:hypothetical protein
MTPEEERLLQKAAAALTAHYVDPGVRDRLLAGGVDTGRAFALLDMAAAHVGGPAAGQDPEQWLDAVTAVATDGPGITRSVVVFEALASVTGLPADQWATTFALAASPERTPPPSPLGPAANPFLV